MQFPWYPQESPKKRTLKLGVSPWASSQIEDTPGSERGFDDDDDGSGFGGPAANDTTLFG